MDSKQTLEKFCFYLLEKKGLNDQSHKVRLEQELKEIDNQAEYDYFLSLYDKKVKFSVNENNLLVPFLMDIVDEFDINSPSTWVEGEYPDIDVDYLPPIQPYLKNEWAPQNFGRENVCNIGNYSTFGLKSSIIDMARVYSHDRNDMLLLTTPLGKDEEGQELTFETAMEIHEPLRKFFEDNPEVLDAARRIMSRNRGRGKHAGGLVISSSRIDDLVPLTIDTDGNPVSAWTEGLHDQDLQPVGLIKFDVLVIKDLLRIAECVNLIKDRYGLTSINALPDQSDWTDTAYLDDAAALKVANSGDLKGVFQFGSAGIRDLTRKGGVDRFDDLVAYASLFRPGPLGMKMHERYIDRKRGREPGWEREVPDIIKPILLKTYGIMAYQEQVMQILNVVGGIPLIHCEKVRKAISKKKGEEFHKYEPIFVTEGQKRLGWEEEKVKHLWDQIVSFSAYGFNLSHAVAYTYISSRLLWLKAHYPNEFYTCTLRHEVDTENIHQFKIEAEDKGIKVNRIDLNKSGTNWNLVGDEIYIGFSDIKGIGDKPAKRIIENQPYTGFQDFLDRFGTDANIVRPLILLGAFTDEGSSAVLYEYYENYKEVQKKRNDRDKRNFKTRAKYIEQIKEISPESFASLVTHDYLMSCDYDGEELKELTNEDAIKLIRKYQKCVIGFEKKLSEDEKSILVEFEPTGNVDSEILHLCDQRRAEAKFYGFSWSHPLQDSPDYDSEKTFAQFEWNESLLHSSVQVMITKKPEHKKSKKGHDLIYLKAEDARGSLQTIMFYKEDYDRFKEEMEYWNEELQRGNFISINVKRPLGGFRSYTFTTPKKQDRWKEVPKEKEDDHRLKVMKNPSSKNEIINELREF